MKRGPKSAAKLLVLGNSDPISAEIEAIQSRIRNRAFELSQTRPHDAHELYDWVVAEAEIISVPQTELIEKDGMFEVSFAIPAMDAEDLNVMATADQIAVKGESTHDHALDLGTVHLCDFKSSTVFRSISLPSPIDPRSVKVDFADGMLRVTAAIERSEGSASPAAKRGAGTTRKAPAKKSRAKMP